MLNKSLVFAAVLVFSALACAQQRQQQLPAGDAPDSTACAYLYSSGSGWTATRYCLSTNGNIVQFSRPSSVEYIAQGNITEGYGVCDATGGKAYYDYAQSNSGNWGATTVTEVNATTRKFVRTTSDGIWQLTQTILQGKAGVSRPGTVQVTMEITNHSHDRRSVFLLRAADVDIGSVWNDEEFDFTWDTASGSNPGVDYGLSLTTNTFKFSHLAFTQNTYQGPDPCNFQLHLNGAPFVGDGSIGHVYGYEVPSGSSMKVIMTYRPI